MNYFVFINYFKVSSKGFNLLKQKQFRESIEEEGLDRKFRLIMSFALLYICNTPKPSNDWHPSL